jgi:hypothetical protein
MSVALRLRRFAAGTSLVGVLFAGEKVLGQPIVTVPPGAYWGAAAPGIGPAPFVGFTAGTGEAVSFPAQVAPMPMRQPARPRGPLARLVKNPDSSDGAPPFALADQHGRVQRLVESAPGIDLAPYVGEVVVLRHDTGPTVLASQLELPRRADPIEAAQSAMPAADTAVQPVRFADDDDTTTEMLQEGEPAATSSGARPADAPLMPQPAAGTPVIDGALMPEELVLGDPLTLEGRYSDPLRESVVLDELSGEFGGFGPGACPHCGGQHGGEDCAPDFRQAIGKAPQTCQVYADAKLNFLRVHFMEGGAGKLSEKYELSPRFTVGYEGSGLIDGRVRYWIYDRATPLLGGGAVRFDFDVWDIEATHRLKVGRSSAALAVGMRLASIDLVDVDGDEVGSDMLGMTFAADAYTPVCNFEGGLISWVYGARLSILGGDWNGDQTSDFIEAPLRDDNVVADEIYVGIQYARRFRDYDLRARLAFEMQNWHSDALAQNAGTDSVGFLGPGIQVGATF